MEWRVIEDYPEYEVSNTGVVRRAERILKQSILRHGYTKVTLSSSNNQKDMCIHRLVATAFIPNPENNPQVDHINRIRTDNRVENLRWVTCSENQSNTKSRSPHHNISKKGHGGYEVQIIRNKQIVCKKWTKTLEEAIAHRDQVLINNTQQERSQH
jgi:hypothetical protein